MQVKLCGPCLARLGVIFRGYPAGTGKYVDLYQPGMLPQSFEIGSASAGLRSGRKKYINSVKEFWQGICNFKLILL